MKPYKNRPKIIKGDNGVKTDDTVATFGLPEVNVYPNNRWGDIARSQGLETARNWRKVKEGTTKGINDFANDPRTQFVSMMLPLPQGIDAVGGKVAGVVDRLTDKPRRVSSMVEYFSPFGYKIFNTYDGKIPEGFRWINGYVLRGKDIPKGGGWSAQRMKIEPFRTESRKQAFRRYLGAPKSTDKLYIENSDGTFRYNPEIIPQENIEFQRKHFFEKGNGNPATEYLTSDIHGAKGARGGNAGGLISKIDSEGNFIIDDVWDLMPLQQFKWLPKSIQDVEVGKFIGGKPFKVYDTEIGKIKK